MSNKIIFIVGSLSQPRCIKRILSFVNAGFDCEVYGYDRKKYNCNALPSEIKVTVLGEMVDGTNYFNKLKTYQKDIRRIIRLNKNDSTLFYSFELMASFFLYLRGKRFIYEISDIPYAYPRFSKVLFLLKAIDKRIIKKSIATVMTSKGFYDFYDLKCNKIIIQPNKVSSLLSDLVRQPMCLQSTSKLVFSFVGAIRYDTVFRFAEVIGRFFPQHEFHFYGQATGKSLERCSYLTNHYINVKYFGAFKNPEDLSKLYNNINVIVACYTPSSLNERLAEPNKLYEAMFFCKPIVVSDGIFLSSQVQHYGCGFCIDATNEQSIVSFINNLNADDINRISEKEAQINTDELIDNPGRILKQLEQYSN